jgi:hypothetical protein
MERASISLDCVCRAGLSLVEAARAAEERAAQGGSLSLECDKGGNVDCAFFEDVLRYLASTLGVALEVRRRRAGVAS